MQQISHSYLHQRLVHIVRSGMLASFIILFVCSFTEPDYFWTSPSKNASESMPCGGGDIGTNIWVENGDILFYVSKNGAFDENNTLLKQGRFRIHLTPNPLLETKTFRQTLKVNDGFVEIRTSDVVVNIWVDVFKPIINVEINGKKNTSCEIRYENWRFGDREIAKKEGQQNSYKWATPAGLQMRSDSVSVENNGLVFYHKNPMQTIFDITVAQQGLENQKANLYNPLKNLISGGKLVCEKFVFKQEILGTYAGTPYKAWVFESKNSAKKHTFSIALETSQHEKTSDWLCAVQQNIKKIDTAKDRKMSMRWWNEYWQRSFIHIEGKDSSLSTNYALFRYMLGCNAFGKWPKRFNGSLFTFDPVFTDSTLAFTSDYRKWGGGTYTAQNQRLVYWPMLKNGDFDLMQPQFEFYLRLLNNAETRTKTYWNHGGACFSEQLENFGLPNPSEYGWKRPADFDKGVEYNAWLEYQWETVLEFCQMILESRDYGNCNIEKYKPFIESCLRFFDEHYQYLANARGRKSLDGEGHLILYPASGCETYKMANNPANTIAALQSLAKEMNNDSLLKKIPPIPLREQDHKTMISPAKTWERINNTECPQLYPVFPWRMYGVGKPDLEIARNTYLYDTDAIKFRSHIGWKQDNIFAACLGLTDEAKRLAKLKLANGPYRFPAFWGPGFDWSPDFNWGGSGMIGLQEMIIQTTDDGKILLFPSWPSDWNVHFKLHAPQNTTIEARIQNGKVEVIEVLPVSRLKDVVITQLH